MSKQHKQQISPQVFMMTRRRFSKSLLATVAATQCGLFEFASTLFADTTSGMRKANVHVVVVRPKEHKANITWPGGQVDIVAMQSTFTKTLNNAARELGVQLDVRPKPMATQEDLTAYLKEVKANPPDGILVLAMELFLWGKIINPMVQNRGDIPIIVYSNMSSFTGHQQAMRKVPRAILAATQDIDWLKVGLRMFHTMVRMKNTRIAMVHDRHKGKSPWSAWQWGPNFHYVPEGRWDDEIKKVDNSEEIRAIADYYARNAQKVVEPSHADILASVKVYVALQRIMQQENCQGITCNCLPFARRTGDTACLAYSRLQDEGIVACCEADQGGSTIMLLSHLLLERPAFIQDPSPNTVNNTLIASHCTFARKVKGFNDSYQAPYLLRDYHTRSGVAVQILWPTDTPVTVIEQAGNSMLVGTGQVVSNIPNPPSRQWGGCRTTIEIKMNDVYDTRNIIGFHQMVVYGDFERQLQQYGKLVGIDVKPITAETDKPKSQVAAVNLCPCRCHGEHGSRERLQEMSIG